MSVQAGMFNFDGQTADEKLLNNFSELLKQQGPDGESSYRNGSLAMLYRPFHTTAESRNEKQPHTSRRGFVLTWDGRLDNREELIAELRGDLEEEFTDVAIIAAAFDRWGTDCFNRIIGDWGISIWKPEARELVFAIDYMAVRHIFYYLKKNRISWATDLAALVLLSGDKFHIDDEYVAGYFAHDPDAQRTPYCEIREVPPGQFVCVRDGRATVHRYWRFNPRSRIRYKTDTEYEEHFRCIFRQSVRRRLRSDSPILAELSGGLDSSSIVCMADDILANNDASAPRLETLSYFDKSEPHGDDWLYFPKIEEKRRQQGHHIDVSRLGAFPNSLEYSEFAPLPGNLGSGRNIEVERADIARRCGYRVVLSGLGGDEFMGGIPDPTAQIGDLLVQCRPLTLAKQLLAWSLVKRRPWIHLFLQAVASLLPPAAGQYFIKQAKVEPWIAKGFASRTRIPIRLLNVSEHFGLWLPTRRSYIGGVMLMSNKMAKRTPPKIALEETRYPYLDYNLIEFVLSIPATQLLRPGERRSLMRRSLTSLVPAEILSRRTKQFGARTPVTAVERNLGQLNSMFRSSLSCQLGYVNEQEFLKNLNAAKNGKEIHIVRMFRTISLELWLRDLVSRHLIDLKFASSQTTVGEALQANV